MRRSQFSSLTISPVEIPNICVCTAPETPVVHRSDDEEPTPGDIAEGGGDITIVRDLASVSTDDSEVESVITVLVVCAKAAPLRDSRAIVKIILIVFKFF